MTYTCCLFIPARMGAIAISVFGVLASAAFGVVYAKEIEDGIFATPDNLPAAKFIPYMSMASWMLLALISLFGCIASWTAKPRLAMIYFWSLLVQYIFDLGFMGATFFFSIQVGQMAKESCLDKAAAEALLAIFGAWKLYSTYTVYAIFTFKRWTEKEALEKAAQKIMQSRPEQEWRNYDSDTTRNWSKFED